MLAWLKEPSLKGLRPGEPEFFTAQKRLIHNHSLLKWNYDDWYSRLLADIRSAPPDGLIVELGSGGSYLKDLEPSTLTSDVEAGIAERVIDARKLPFEANTVRALVLTHVFHHIPQVDAFLNEAERVLMPGGVISMIEVAHTPFARFFFKNFHHEPYDDQRTEWSFSQADSMMDSNQALAWIVFVRDRPAFEKAYPSLAIDKLEWVPWLTYLMSGGVTARYFIPRFADPLLIGLEKMLKPLGGVFSLSWHVCIRKK